LQAAAGSAAIIVAIAAWWGFRRDPLSNLDPNVSRDTRAGLIAAAIQNGQGPRRTLDQQLAESVLGLGYVGTLGP